MITPSAPQKCAHLGRHGRGRKTTVTGGLVVEVCKACVRELGERFAEAERPPTPIEQHAQRAEVEMANGCTYNVGKKDTVVPCRMLCDKGQEHCPRHIVIAAHEAELAARREHDKEMKRGTTKITPYTAKAAQ